jgi:tRNA (Thr-GGU) A37 N-methylase
MADDAAQALLAENPSGSFARTLEGRGHAPKQGSEGAPDAWLDVQPWATKGLRGIAIGDNILIVTWLHRGRRDVLRVHPREDRRRSLTGVFATRSPDRPNPLGLHPVTVRKIIRNSLRSDRSKPSMARAVVDIKPVLASERWRDASPACARDRPVIPTIDGFWMDVGGTAQCEGQYEYCNGAP